jgi:hypothetical protein
MLCPSCGPHGHLEQVLFSSEYEKFRCVTCGNMFVSYPIGNGLFSEPVPASPPSSQSTIKSVSKNEES